jgi:hypothetical protein
LLSLPLYKKNRGERGRGGHCAAAPKATWGARSLLFSPPRGSSRVRGYTSGFIVGKKNFLLPLPRTSKGRRRLIVPFKTAPFGSLFFFVNSAWNGTVSFKRKIGQTCQSSHWSLICDLFNRVLNCNFDCKNQFNCIPAKFNCQPWSWSLFSHWSLVLNLYNLTLNWSINF